MVTQRMRWRHQVGLACKAMYKAEDMLDSKSAARTINAMKVPLNMVNHFNESLF
jgi:hypothetical protein